MHPLTPCYLLSLQGPNGLAPAKWADAFSAIKSAVSKAKGNEIKAIAGKLAEAESMIALKDMMNKLGSGNLMHEGGFPDMSADVRSTYLANTGVMGLEQSDVVLLIGTNPRVESPVYNARIRKAWLDGTQVCAAGRNRLCWCLFHAFDYRCLPAVHIWLRKALRRV